MAIINIDDAYILDETGAQVDKVTGLYFKNENASDTEKAQARANIGAGGTNDNLLDNAYFVGGGSQLGYGIFPINQRGQTQYTGGGVQLDRWHGWAGTDTLVLTANGLQYTSPSSNGIFQYFPVFPTTETVTFSAKIGGTIYSVTLPEGQNQVRLDQPTFGLTVDRNDKAVGIFSYNSTILLQAAKLEVGTVSTLANDAPPDFGAELAKCKAYFQRVKQPQGYTAPIGFGIIGASSNILRTLIPLSSPLRDATSITASATNIGQMKVWGNGSYFTPSAITGRTVLNGHAVVDITVNGSLQNYMVYHIILEDASTYIDLSAEL